MSDRNNTIKLNKKYGSRFTPEKNLKTAADWKKYNDAIIAREKAKQKPRVETLSPVTVASDSKKIETRPRATRLDAIKKDVAISPIAAPVAGNIAKRATTKTDKQKKAATKAADVRQRGTDALKAGKLGKARRLSRRYQNLKKKM